MEKGNAGEMRKRRRCGVVLQEDCPPFQLLLAHRPPPPSFALEDNSRYRDCF